MKRGLSLVCLVLCLTAARASPVVWGQFEVSSGPVFDPVSRDVVPGLGITCYCDDASVAFLLADVGLGYEMRNGRLVAVSPAYFPQMLEAKAKFVQAFAGDVLTDAFIEQAPLVADYHISVGHNEVYGDQSMPVTVGKPIYLAFKAKGGVFEEGEEPVAPEDIYGWIMLEVFRDHLELAESAFGDRQGMIVGTGAYEAIPEPSGALLLLVGAGLLGLRRRRASDSDRSAIRFGRTV
ncbi:MAG: PEP-CTERM sorting domain-containing protein [Kiritimatiellia bacterium]